MTPVNPEQLRNQLQLLTAEVDLHTKELIAWKKRGESERNLYSWIADRTVDPSESREPLKRYHQAHKEHYEAEANLKTLHIAKLKSQCAVAQAMLGEAENLIKHPPSNLVTS